MKTTIGSALILGAAVAFVSEAADLCNTTALSQLTATENVSTCSADSGYSLTSMAIPSDAQITAFCSSNACKESINAVTQVAPDECTIGPIRLYADVINPLSQRCGMSSGSGSVSASGSAADDVGSGSIAGNTAFSGSAMNHSNASNPQPNTRPNSDSPTPAPASRNGGAEAPALSMCAAIAVLATIVAAIL